MPREKNDMVGQLEQVGDSTIKVNGVLFKMAPASAKFLKFYKPGDRVYIDIGEDNVVVFMQQFEKWKAKYPTKAQKYDIQEVGIKAAEKAVEAISGNVGNVYGNRTDMDLMKSAAACATGLVKSMIEKGWFAIPEGVNDGTPMEKVRPLMNQLMFAIYIDQKQILQGTSEP